MRLKIKRINMALSLRLLAKPIALLAIVVMISSGFVNAQRTITKVQKAAPVGQSIVFCNEKDTMTDRVSLPSGGIMIKEGRIAAWRYQMSEQQGNYKFSVRSESDFAILVRKRVGGKGNWFTVNTGNTRSKMKFNSGTNQSYYFWESLLLRQGPDNALRQHVEFAVSARPTRKNQNFSASWYTSGCKTTESNNSKTTESNNSCKWVDLIGDGLFGMTCQCGGKTAAPSRCGKKP